MRWPIGRIAALAAATKRPLAVAGRPAAHDRFLGDDGVPVPGSDVIAACDAVVPSLVERDPEWAGWVRRARQRQRPRGHGRRAGRPARRRRRARRFRRRPDRGRAARASEAYGVRYSVGTPSSASPRR